MHSMASFNIRGKSLDLGCGDGLFSFIRAGGGFKLSMDAFKHLANLENFHDSVDIYDAYSPTCEINTQIAKSPAYRMSVGFDHKQTLLQKAEQLNFYDSLLLGDANKPLPFDDHEFDCVFSNILYWLEDPAFSLSELSRIIKPNGQLCIMLPTDNLAKFCFVRSIEGEEVYRRFRFSSKLDRGRLTDNIKQVKSINEWKNVFLINNLEVVKMTHHLCKPVMQVWDVGLRPIFPFLVRMADSLSAEQLIELKKDWVSFFRPIVEDFIDVENTFQTESTSSFCCVILEKK